MADKVNGEGDGVDWVGNIKGMVRRVRNPDVQLEQEVSNFSYSEKPGAYRAITDEERAEYSLQYFHLDQDLVFYQEQKVNLKRKFHELMETLDKKIARSEAGKGRLSEILLYQMIAMPVSEIEKKSSKPTSLLTPSQQLREEQAQGQK